MDVRYGNIPHKFIEIHFRDIHNWLVKYINNEARSYLNIHLYEPLASIAEGSTAETVDVPTLTVKSIPMRSPTGNYTKYEVSADKVSMGLIEAWAEKHKNTTRADFDWFPTFQKE